MQKDECITLYLITRMQETLQDFFQNMKTQLFCYESTAKYDI
jgi:hypothetical protein